MFEPSSSKPGVAVVTGASSGIGKVYARQLAARGYDVVLVARREERLRQLASELTETYGVMAEPLVADLAQPDGVQAVSARIAGDGAVSFLVNNAGFSVLKPLTDTADASVTDMIALNVTALTILSKAALAAFKERGAGTLVNVGSGAGFAPYPGIPVYGATKAYVYLFTQAIQSEVEGTDVRVQLVLPGAVESEAWDVAGGADLDPLPAEIVMSADDLVGAALVGLEQAEQVTIPSLHDEVLLTNYQKDGGKLLQAVFDAKPAARYANAE